MADLDLAAKVLLQEVPHDFVALARGDARAVRAARSEDAELPALARRMDRLIRFELEGEEGANWMNVEIQANWKANVPARVFEYWSLAFLRFKRLETLVICLRPGKKQGRPVARFETATGETRLTFTYRLVLVWEHEATALLEGPVGLVSLLPFAKGATEELVDLGLTRLATVQPLRRRAELVAALATFAEDAFPGVTWADRMPEELLMTSSIYQKGLAKGRVEGRVEGREEGRVEGREEGRHQVVGAWLRQRVGEDASRFERRLSSATPTVWGEVARLLGSELTKTDLTTALDELLPAPPEAS